jgi:hypothetical protein
MKARFANGEAARLVPPFIAKRAYRTAVLLTVVAVFNVFDLAFTQSQLSRGNFAEANALATALAWGAPGLLAYKALLFGLGATILYRFRRRWEAEAGLWALTACYAGLMIWWVAYLGLAEVCVSDPAVRAPPIAY